ncbi:MAG: methyltransferase domain-containing protein [Candidatus Omnitrophica bacterium]|nr:methyltransferase domain-containing protein [Candidatus Omnitrophota bacterium]
MNKQAILKNFSRCAEYYDFYSNIQNECAMELIRMFRNKNFQKILEPGCGTGNYTMILKNRFPDARITAFDLSPEMINRARGKLNNDSVDFSVKDAEEPGLSGKFDLITSNAVFQWLEDIKNAFEKYKRLLVPEGVFAFSMFGPDTFKELQKVLSICYKKDFSISAGCFMSENEIRRILKSTFGHVYIFEETIRIKYESLFHLLETIKYTGIRGDVKTGNLWTKNFLTAIQNLYIEIFGGIMTTYQIFLCKTENK